MAQVALDGRTPFLDHRSLGNLGRFRSYPLRFSLDNDCVASFCAMTVRKLLIMFAAGLLLCLGTPVFASDMPSMPDKTWKAVLILSCIPALLVVPLFAIRTIIVWIGSRSGASPPSRTQSRWWLSVLLVSITPWVIVVPWVLIEFASISSLKGR